MMARKTAQHSENQSENPCLVPCFVLVDYIFLSGLVVLWFFLWFTDYLPSVAERGFWCEDRDHSLPYQEDKIVTELHMYLICGVAPLVAIIYGEWMMAMCGTFGRFADQSGRNKMVVSCRLRIHPCVRRIVRFCGMFTVGFFSTWILTDLTQRFTGRLTPYFLTVCQPEYSTLDCTQFVTSYFCNDTGKKVLVDQARRSFPSLHASLGSFSSVFLTTYVTTQVVVPNARLPPVLLSMATVGGAFMWGASRVASHRHFWSDVWTGFFVGTLIALYLALCVLHNFNESDHISDDSDQDNFFRTFPTTPMRFPRIQHISQPKNGNASRRGHTYSEENEDSNNAHMAASR